ncbi:hypothetical protein ACFQZQ_02935 [Lysobacter koreensis]|uniref:Portal protein n=1 Tax=Lysobacter koreensis TaxID=266122 RepID=A0ABW2YL96_9GAMM
MPGLMEALSGDEIVSFEPDAESEEKGADDATKYVSHLIYEKNDGFVTLHDAIKSCLIARMGVVKVYCDRSEEEKEEKYRGISAIELQALESDSEIEVVSAEPSEYQPQLMEGMPPELGQAFDVVCKRKQNRERFVCEGVPPEEIRIARDCRTIGDLRFIAHEVERTASDLITDGWPRSEVDKIPSGSTAEGEFERDARHDYDGSWDQDDDGDASQRKITVTEAYIRVDFDGDGKAEYRRVLKAGKYIHENEVTDDHPFAVFSPILMPYKVIGLSFYDLIEDLQRIKTALTRQVLDNVYLSNNPRTEVLENQVNLDDLLNPRPGGLVRVKQIGATREVAVPFVASAGLEIIQQIDQVRDTRSGVTEANSALNAESLAKGAIGSEGVQSMMQAGAQRQKLIARVLAETGLKRMHLLMLKLVTQYQDRPAQIKVTGSWLDMDPREWKNVYRVSVKVGLGSHDKAQKIANLTLLGNMQKEMLMGGLIAPDGVMHTANKLAKAMGYTDPAEFFPPAQPQPQQPDPAVVLEQMKQQGAQQLAMVNGQVQQQLAQVKSQTDMQTEAMKQEAQAQQAQQETQLEAERNALEMQNTMAIERYKAELHMQTEIQKAQIAQQTALQTAEISRRTAVESAQVGKGDGKVGEDGNVSHPLDGVMQQLGALIEQGQPKPRRRSGSAVRGPDGRLHFEINED